jgi:hypothetical protein
MNADYFKGYTDAELYSFANRIYQRCQRDMAGGLSFGMDWPTLRAVFPRRAEVMRAAQAEWNRRHA